MITITEIGGKLKISTNGDHLTSPFTAKSYGTNVAIIELQPSGGNLNYPYTVYEKSDSSTFASAEELIDYLTPFMGFSPASGGSGANTEYTETIPLSDAQIATLGSNPVVLSTSFANQKGPGQHYNIKEIQWRCYGGGSPYSSERVNFYGCFNAILPTNSLPSEDAIAIIRAQSTQTFVDGTDLYSEAPFNVIGQELSVSTYTGDDPTVIGNGMVVVVVSYTIIDF
nr:hypothetical protein [uncultured Fluviicola sp.]